jgi:DNA-binding Xre family transcriptional regulator
MELIGRRDTVRAVRHEHRRCDQSIVAVDGDEHQFTVLAEKRHLPNAAADLFSGSHRFSGLGSLEGCYTANGLTAISVSRIISFMTPLRIRLKEAREAKGLTQLALADLAGVRQATISEMETGAVRRVSLDVLERLADALGVEPGELLEREPRTPRKGRQ